MNPRTRLLSLFYFSALVLTIIAAETGSVTGEQIAKPLLMPLLMFLPGFASAGHRRKECRLLMAALLFSWAGDVLLLFQASNSLFFLLGLSAFLLAHVFYIILFHRIRVQQGLRPLPWLLVAVVLYYAVLLSWLSPYLGSLQWPVRIYGIVISTMLLLALHLAQLKSRTVSGLLVAGAILFVLSDSILAINKFIVALPLPSVLIMTTYGMAQFLLTLGIIKYLRAGTR
jgi:uncharacterized membrane protein YhhN